MRLGRPVQGGEDTQDALILEVIPAKEPYN